MPVKTFRPITPSRRYMTVADFGGITKSKPEKDLVVTKVRSGGRNCYGRVTSRGIGGGHKQKIRSVDFKRRGNELEGRIIRIEYDPLRTARLALVEQVGGQHSYTLCAEGMSVGDTVASGERVAPTIGNTLPLRLIPLSTVVHSVELIPGKGGQLARAAGAGAILMSRGGEYVQLRLPSGEIRKIHQDCHATIGQVGNGEHENVHLGKAGRSRHIGKRPISRGVARNPVDHPNGGGAGKSKSGGGWQQLTSPWGLIAKGYRTREKRKASSKFIIVRRDGKVLK